MAEQRVLEFDLRVLSLNLDELVMLCEYMKVKKDLNDGKTKLAMVKVIRHTVENGIVELR